MRSKAIQTLEAHILVAKSFFFPLTLTLSPRWERG
jgi:hypothetical protein